MRDDFGAGRDLAGLDAAVALLHRFGAGRSGGRTRRAALQGGKIAEALGDSGFQLRLIVLHDEQIVAFAILDRPADLALAEDRVAGDDAHPPAAGP